MKKTPKPKKEIAISFILRMSRSIVGNGTQDSIASLVKFGSLTRYNGNEFHLYVDARYDFDEVVEYIENYGVES